MLNQKKYTKCKNKPTHTKN